VLCGGAGPLGGLSGPGSKERATVLPDARNVIHDKDNVVQGGGESRDGNISLWEILCFQCVRNFPLNSQAAVQNIFV
jgi:hypothetical protein